MSGMRRARRTSTNLCECTSHGPHSADSHSGSNGLPSIASKRAASWMRAVCELFQQQCGMPLFMYGMYKTEEGKMQAVV